MKLISELKHPPFKTFKTKPFSHSYNVKIGKIPSPGVTCQTMEEKTRYDGSSAEFSKRPTRTVDQCKEFCISKYPHCAGM